MTASWRRLTAVTVVALGVTAGARVALASPSPSPSPRPTSAGSDVRLVPIDVPPVIPAESTAQVVTVVVRPGGPIRVEPADDDVVLRRVGRGNRFTGVLHATVVDPRGSLAGWQLLVTTGDAAIDHVRVIPRTITGPRPNEVHPTGAARVRTGEPRVVAVALADGGGGPTGWPSR